MRAIPKEKNQQKEETKFIEKIKFQEIFPPFAEGQEIEFGGEQQVQELIEFYLKNKKDYSHKLTPKENAERFKINCLLGSNGGGKSRLFEVLLLKGSRADEIIHPKVRVNGHKIQYDNRNFFLDDFFKLSINFDKSINKEIIEGSYNDFFIQIYNFLQDFPDVINSYLNTGINHIILLGINHLNLNLKSIMEKEENFDEFLSKIYTDYESLFKILHTREGTDMNDKKINLLDSFFLLTYQYYSTTALRLIQEYIDFKKSINSEDKDKEYKILGEIKLFYDRHFNNLSNIFIRFLETSKNISLHNEVSELYDNLTDYLLEFENSDDFISGSFEKSTLEFKKNEDKHNDFFTKNYAMTHLIGSFYEFTKDECIILSKYFNLDIYFGKKGNRLIKTFNSLSAGEKVIITRLINAYYKIVDVHNNGNYKDHDGKKKTDYTLLIDEPDLHLHLDWQRQYIQKLIDVFSTLPEEINIHFIIATHSPFIISDLPGECIIKLKGDGKGNTEVSYMAKEEQKTFGANYIDLIQNGFFFEDKKLMGSFAESVIGGIAEEERESLRNNKNYKSELKDEIGDDFIRENLLYFKKKENATD